MSETRTVFSMTEQETEDLGYQLGRHLRGGEWIVLAGELGLGKTVFARGVARGLEIPVEEVSSPSYTLVQLYEGGRLPMFHLDLYRIENDDELPALGLEELCDTPAVVVVEWGERLPATYRERAIHVRFHDIGEDTRRIEIGPDGVRL